MLRLVLTVLAFNCLGRLAIGGDVKPPESDVPLFSIYECIQDKDVSPGTHASHQGKLLLTVGSLSDLLLQADKKAVRIVLDEADAKALKKITTEHQLLLFVSGDKSALAVILGSKPVENGSIFFGAEHFTGDLAAYIRKRFHCKPGTNEIQKSEQSQPRAKPITTGT